ncbi:hypothetical protein [Paraburkholderia sp. SIMBA_054]|uniref:hypothetical protein n=1 Tax=Paraburkholderia sp. SIMBA_054 TaxID=3085795 RepID=UPI00397C6751
MTKWVRSTGTLLLAAIGFAPVHAQTASDQVVAQYIAQKYGSGNDLSIAAATYANALAQLWDKAVVKLQYDPDMTLSASLAETCFLAKLERVNPGRATELNMELKKNVAHTPVRYAGYVIAGQLADQNFAPPQQLTEQQACRLVRVPSAR